MRVCVRVCASVCVCDVRVCTSVNVCCSWTPSPAVCLSVCSFVSVYVGGWVSVRVCMYVCVCTYQD